VIVFPSYKRRHLRNRGVDYCCICLFICLWL